MIKLELFGCDLENLLKDKGSTIRKISEINHQLKTSHFGSDDLGWFHVSTKNLREVTSEIERIKFLLLEKIDFLVVIGIGGSYLGSKAAIEFLKKKVEVQKSKKVSVIYLGYNLDVSLFKQKLEFLKKVKFAVAVISKSGTTLETLLTAELLISLLQKKEPNWKEYVVCITEKNTKLHQLSVKKGFHFLEVPKNVGGRFSFFTAANLFPISFVGIDINKLINGAELAKKAFSKDDNIRSNISLLYPFLRKCFYDQKINFELFITYNHRLFYFNEWLKQLFAESEGKESKGLWPFSLMFPTDLHSFGQIIQEGKKIFFETTIFEELKEDFFYPKNNFNLLPSGIEKKSMREINNIIFTSTLVAHSKNRGIPNIVLKTSKINEEIFGYLVFFFLRSCAVSGYLLGINPFNQPGVEVYKKNIKQSLK